MTDIDDALGRLRELPVDPRLSMIDAAVFDGMNQRPASSRGPSGALFATAAIVALITGILGSALPGAPTGTAPNPFPLGAPAALAPSTLLASAR